MHLELSHNLNIVDENDQFPVDAAFEKTFCFDLNGILIEIPRKLLTIELWNAFSKKYYEYSEIAAIQQVVRPGDVILEIGGGIGFISSYILRIMKAGRVHIFEADPDLIPIIEHNLALNGVTAQIEQGIVGNCDGPVNFHRQPSFWASSVIPLPGGASITARGVSFARLLKEVKPDVVVVDIEGGEKDLFDGIEFGGTRAVIVEVHRTFIGGEGVARCFTAMAKSGFAYDANTSSGANVTFTPFDKT